MLSHSLLSFTLLAVVSAVSRVHAQTCDRNYTVVAGDTCDGICQKENVSTFQLITSNANIINANCTNLFTGEELCLGFAGQDCEITHVVVSGDSCLSIAQATNTTLDIILANNPNVNNACSNIHPGEVLCTANSVIVKNSTSL